MGSFSYTCSVSKLPIHDGDEVRFMLLSSSPYDEPSYCTMNAGYFPRTFPIKAKYNDYGSVQDVEEGVGRDLWLEGFKIDLLSVGVGDNYYHDVSTSKNMSFDDLLQALVCDRVRVDSKVGDISRKELFLGKLPKTPKGVPTIQRVNKIIKKHNYSDKVIIDKLKYGEIRVRWDWRNNSNEYGKDEEKLLQIQPLFNEYATVITAGNGRYPSKADLLVYTKPGTEGFHGSMKAEKNNPLRVVQMMIREDVWQSLLSTPSGLGYSLKKVNADYYLDQVMYLYEAFIKRIKSNPKYLLHKNPSNDEWKEFFKQSYNFYDLKGLDNNDAAWMVRKNEVPFTVGLATHWDMFTHRCLPAEGVKHVLQSVSELLHVYNVMSDIRIGWTAGNSIGPQYGNWESHKIFHKRMMQITTKQKKLEEKR